MRPTTLAFTAVSLLQLASAQPHRVRHARRHQLDKKGAVVVVTVVNTVYAEPTLIPQVEVLVDQWGNPLTTMVRNVVPERRPVGTPGPGLGPTPYPVAEASSSSSASSTAAVESYAPQSYVPPTTPQEPAGTYVPAPVDTTPPAPAEKTPDQPAYTPAPPPPAETTPEKPAYTPAPPPPAETTPDQPAYTPAPPTPTSAPIAAPTGAAPGSGGFGLVYSPYKADGTCKSQSEVAADFESISSEYKLIRTYGTDCDQVANVLSVVKARNIKLFAGIYDLTDLAAQVATIVEAARGDWAHFDTISVGNELVNFGAASAATVVAAIGTVRGLLRAANYPGHIVTVDTLVAARANPSICDASDYCAINCHPFFDGQVAAEDAGKFLTEQVPTLREKLANPNQRVVITETGWPWQGQTNGAAVPSLPNQAAALASIKTAYSANPESIILFTAFNDVWKKNTAAQFGAEQYWGLGGANPPSG
ncbi:unnamed protein product [Diplocarpon coronariae]|nr:cell wall glucanase [Diplocarpon mali]